MQMEMKREAEIVIVTSDKTDFKTKAIVRREEGQYIMIKGTIQQEDITLVNIYAPNIGGPKYIKQILMDIKGGISSVTVIAEDLTSH